VPRKIYQVIDPKVLLPLTLKTPHAILKRLHVWVLGKARKSVKSNELTSEEDYALSRLLNSPLKIPLPTQLKELNEDLVQKIFAPGELSYSIKE
jgi:hypothetical protein